MASYLLTACIAMGMVCSAVASSLYGRGIYGRVMLDSGDMEGGSKEYGNWNIEKVKLLNGL